MTSHYNQPSFFDAPTYPDVPGYAPRETSKEAARLIEPKCAALRHRVLAEIQIRGSFGATCDELEQAFGMSHQTVSARCRELNMTGKTRDSGNRRPTRTGRKAIVWVAKEGQR